MNRKDRILNLKAGLRVTFCILMLSLASLAPLSANEIRSEDQRFTDHGNNTVTDSKTGLMWQKQDSYLATGHWLNWNDAFTYVKQLNDDSFGGYIDWRMPTLDELRTLYEEDKINSKQLGREMVIHMDPVFGREGAGSHWSSESNGEFNAFGIVFNTGRRFSAPKKSKARKSVRAVRNHMAQ